MNAHSSPQLVASGRLRQANDVRRKVEQDIVFLSNRIADLETQPRPNRPVIDSYRTMLESRKSVLKWLQDGTLETPTPYIRSL